MPPSSNAPYYVLMHGWCAVFDTSTTALRLALHDLAVGDAVTFSVDATTPTQIDTLHGGDEAKNRPAAPQGTAPGA